MDASSQTWQMWAHGGCVWRKAFWFPLLVSISCHVFQRVPLRESCEISPAALAFIRRSISHRWSTWWMRSCGTGWIRAKCSTYVDRDAALFYCLRLCWTSAGPSNSLFVSELVLRTWPVVIMVLVGGCVVNWTFSPETKSQEWFVFNLCNVNK